MNHDILPFDDYASTASKLLKAYKTPAKAGDAIAKAKWRVIIDETPYKITMPKRIIYLMHNPEDSAPEPIKL